MSLCKLFYLLLWQVSKGLGNLEKNVTKVRFFFVFVFVLFFSVYSSPCITVSYSCGRRYQNATVRVFGLKITTQSLQLYGLITILISLAGGKETGKCDGKLNSEHTYMKNHNCTSLPPPFLASAPRYQWNRHFLFPEKFLSWPKIIVLLF